MEWDQEAVAEFIKMPLSKSAKENAKVIAEKLARRNQSMRVTLKEMTETKRINYQDVPEAARQRELEKRIAEGETDLRQSLEKEARDILTREIDLFNVQLCHAQYFRCRSQIIELRELKKELEQKLRDLKVSEMVADSLHDEERLMAHHRVTISVSGCPNGCTGPESKAFGVHGVSRPVITGAVCTECFACVDRCRRGAIIIRDGGLQIDYSRCDLCENCVKVCPTGKVESEAKGYRILVGGRFGRFHQLGYELFRFTDKETLMDALEASLRTIKEEAVGHEGLPDIINRVGVAPIFQRLYREGDGKMTKKTTLGITGMSCEHCVAHVTKALEGVPGVIRARVNLEGGQAQVEYDPAQTNQEAMKKAVVGAGYGISQPGPSATAGSATDSCCD